MTKSPTAKSSGRPSAYTPEIAERIIDGLMDGKGLAAICEADDMPSRRTVLYWQIADADFCAKCARAREVAQEHEIDESVSIADAATPENVHVAKVRIAARQWRASKLAPKKYGDRTQLEHTGRDGGPIQYQDLSKLSDEELDQLERLSAKISSAGGGQGGES